MIINWRNISHWARVLLTRWRNISLVDCCDIAQHSTQLGPPSTPSPPSQDELYNHFVSKSTAHAPLVTGLLRLNDLKWILNTPRLGISINLTMSFAYFTRRVFWTLEGEAFASNMLATEGLMYWGTVCAPIAKSVSWWLHRLSFLGIVCHFWV